MTDHLAIGDSACSGWSLRGWLLFDAFGIPVPLQRARLYTDELPQLLRAYVPSRTVPTLRTQDGTVIPESLAIAEELASRHRDPGLWPAAPRARATARALAAGMHAGFTALRSHCPMKMRVSYADTQVPEAVRSDLTRLDVIWSWSRAQSGSTGPWLCGDYSVADAFYAPVASRIATCNLPATPAMTAHVAAHLAHPSFGRWRTMGLVDGPDQAPYQRDYPTRPWPGPAPLTAAPVAVGQPENEVCPYSAKPVTHLLQAEGRIFGFCNAFCRDKTVADPLASPAFAALWAA